MREMKDSGVPWIGEIPKEWTVRRIKTLFSERAELSETGKETLMSVSEYYGVDSRASHIEEDEHLSRSESLIGYKKCYPGDIVSNIMLAWKGSLGVARQAGIVSPAYCVYKPATEVFPMYYHYLFRTSLYTWQFKCYSKGIIDSRLRLYSPFFYDIPALIPPITEQRHIADFLDAKCAEIDSILEKTRASIEEYKKLKQSVITEAVTKGIRGERPMKDSGVEWIGEMPEEWAAKAIKYCFRVVSGGTPNTNIPEFWDGDIPWITPADYKTEDHYISLGKRNLTIKGLESCNSIMAPKGSVVFSKRAPIGTVAISANELCTNQGCLVCIPKKVYSEYFYYAFTAFKDFFELYGSGTTFKEISITSFVNFRVPVPSFEEQQEIAAYLDEKSAAIDSLIASKEALISELESYKKSLIYEYVTGKKEVI